MGHSGGRGITPPGYTKKEMRMRVKVKEVWMFQKVQKQLRSVKSKQEDATSNS